MDGIALFMLILAAPRLVCKTVGAGVVVTAATRLSRPARNALCCTVCFFEQPTLVAARMDRAHSAGETGLAPTDQLRPGDRHDQ